MSLSINPAKLFKSGKFMMTAAATIAVVASATATTLTSINADDSVAPAKVTTSQKAESQENHMYKGHRFDAPIRVETHDIWTANSESVIADNMAKQGIKSVDQLGDYKVVWGDTLSTIAAHFNVNVEELAQRFNIVDINYIGAGITMNAQRNINALESQVIHDAQWEGDYNAKVAASQASDGTQPAGASDVADAQADATTATNAPVANADAPAQAAKTNQTPAVTPADKPATETPKTDAPAPATNTNKGNDTNIGNASDIIKGVDDGANTPASQPSQPADKPAEAQKPVVETPKTDAPAPATNTDKGNDTNIGNASDVMKGVDDGVNTPAVQPVQPADKPAEAQKPVVETPKTDAPATNTNKGTDTNIGNASDVIKGVDDGVNTPAVQPVQPADKPAEAQKPVSDAPTSAAPSSNASVAPVETQTPASETPKTDAPATNAPTSAAPAGSASATPAAPTTPVETQSPASEAPTTHEVPANPVDKSTFDAPMSHEVPANPVDGSTFYAIDPSSTSSFGFGYGPLTYHTSYSGYSISDLTNGKYQGLWLDTYGNAHNPHDPAELYYVKQDVDNLVPRYIDAQTPVEGTESEGPDGLLGTTYHTAFSGYSVSDLTNGKYQGLSLDKYGNAVDPDDPTRILYTKQDINNLVTRHIDELMGGASSVINSIG